MEKHGKRFRIKRMVKGKSYNLSFDHKPAKYEIEQALAQKVLESEMPKDKRRFRDCLREYIDINDGVLAPTTIQEKESLFRRLPEEFLNKPMCEFNDIYVQKYINDYAKEKSRRGKLRSAKTVSNMWGQISVILNKYSEKKFNINLPQQKPSDDYFPTEEEVIAIREYVRDTEFEIPFLIASFGGLREGEICALTLDDIKDCTIKVNKTKWRNKAEKRWEIKPTPKTDTSNRCVPIPEPLYEMILNKGYIYAYSPNRLLKQLNKAQDALEIPRFKFHTLRAYYTSASHFAGMRDRYIMKNSGHKNVATLQKHYERALRDKQNDQDKLALDHFNSLI